MDQITGPESREKPRAQANRQAGKQANRQAHTHTFLGSPRQFSGIETAGARQLDHRLPGCTHEAQPPQAAPTSCESEEPEYVDGGANEDEDTVVDERGDGLARADALGE